LGCLRKRREGVRGLYDSKEKEEEEEERRKRWRSMMIYDI
jgi:hypothetical protein